jgi:hypothetical protein
VLAEAFFQVKERFPLECADYDIKIKSICQSAIDNAVIQNFERVNKSILEILDRNSLPIEALKVRHLRVLLYRLKNILSYIYRLEINAGLHGIENVFTASLLFHHLQLSSKAKSSVHGANLFLRKLLIRIRKVLCE